MLVGLYFLFNAKKQHDETIEKKTINILLTYLNGIEIRFTSLCQRTMRESVKQE